MILNCFESIDLPSLTTEMAGNGSNDGVTFGLLTPLVGSANLPKLLADELAIPQASARRTSSPHH